jgi:Uma2 family endonuclease
MVRSLLLPPPRIEIEYPESDGKPMADNTLQWEWIVTIKNGLEDLFWEREDVFVASDLLWYPIEGNNRICYAPDVLVVFGRPKGHRGFYKQWEEADIPPQVVFEVLSTSNSPLEMSRKLSAYEQFGPEEYYLYDPYGLRLEGWVRKGDRLIPIETIGSWISPRLGVRFEMASDGLHLYRPDGEPFKTFIEVQRERRDQEKRASALSEEAELLAHQRDEERQRAQSHQRREQAFAAKLREMGIDPETVA